MFESFLFKFAVLVVVALCAFFALLPFANQINDFILRYTVGQRNKILEQLKEIFVEIAPQKLLNILISFSCGVGLVAFFLAVPNFTAAFILFPIITVIAWFIPGIALKVYISKRTEKFNTQLIDTLTLMSSSLRAGQSITQAMELIVQEMPNPVAQEFEQVLKENRLGMSLQESLENLAARVKSDDCHMFVTSVNILEETGGNLAETFSTISSTIRERLKLHQKITGMIAQSRTQGLIIFFLPAVVFFMNYQSDPESISYFFENAAGIIIFTLALIYNLFGGFLLWKITRITV